MALNPYICSVLSNTIRTVRTLETTSSATIGPQYCSIITVIPVIYLKSSITEAKLKTFISTASEGDELTCQTIGGFRVFKNRSDKAASFKFRPPKGKRTQITIGKTSVFKISEASKIAQDMIEAISNGGDPREVIKKGAVKTTRIISGDPKSPSLLGNYFENVYLPDLLRERGEDKAKDQELMIRREFEHLFDKEMSDLSTADIHKWQKTHDQKGSSYSTVVRYFKPLCALLGHAIKESYIKKGENEGLLLNRPFPTNCLKSKTKGQRDTELDRDADIDIVVRRALERSEIERLSQAVRDFNQDYVDKRERTREHAKGMAHPSLKNVAFSHWFIPFFLIAYYTGMRMGDILNLEWKHVREKQIVKVTNKSSGYDKPVKLVIDITDHKGLFDFSLLEVLTEWRKQCQGLKAKWVFPQEADSTKHMVEYKKSWRNLLEKTGKGKKGKVTGNITLREQAIRNGELILDLYSMRHNFISVQCREGVPLTQIIRLSGHKTTDMIVQHYSHHLPEDMERAMRLVY